MNQKLSFAAQVFSTLVLFLAIFIVTLERGTERKDDANQPARVQEDVSENSTGFFFSPFTYVLKDVLEGTR